MEMQIPQVMYQLSKASKFVPLERISERMCEHVVDVSVPQVVERTIEQFVEVLKFVSQDRIQQRSLKQISDTSGGTRRSSLISPQDGVQHRFCR